MLSFLEPKNLEQGIKIYEDFPGSERVKNFGFISTGIKVIKANL
jgi:hypothetical protein